MDVYLLHEKAEVCQTHPLYKVLQRREPTPVFWVKIPKTVQVETKWQENISYHYWVLAVLQARVLRAPVFSY